MNDATRNSEHGKGSYCDDSTRSNNRPDWQVPGWYRMMSPAGTKMPEVAVPFKKCGTWGTGWLNGNHPNLLGGTVDRTVCFNQNGYYGSTCQSSRSVKVKNCGGYFLYYLPKSPTSNYCTRYCAE